MEECTDIIQPNLETRKVKKGLQLGLFYTTGQKFSQFVQKKFIFQNYFNFLTSLFNKYCIIDHSFPDNRNNIGGKKNRENGLWNDLDKDQRSRIALIMVHQRINESFHTVDSPVPLRHHNPASLILIDTDQTYPETIKFG